MAKRTGTDGDRPVNKLHINAHLLLMAFHAQIRLLGRAQKEAFLRLVYLVAGQAISVPHWCVQRMALGKHVALVAHGSHVFLQGKTVAQWGRLNVTPFAIAPASRTMNVLLVRHFLVAIKAHLPRL